MNLKNILIFQMNNILFFYVYLELIIIKYYCPSKRENGVNLIGKTANCEPCQKNQIGDENHYIFECTNFSEKRKSLLPKHVIKHSNIIE